jgi:hypothetical protein
MLDLAFSQQCKYRWWVLWVVAEFDLLADIKRGPAIQALHQKVDLSK